MRQLLYLWLLAMLSLVTAFHCTTPSETIMAHNVSSAEHIQARSASGIKAKLAIPWPLMTRNGKRLRVIKYCYADKYTRDLFDCPKVQDAFTLWAMRLGYPASQATGHSLAWDEADDGNPDPPARQIEYCFLPGLVQGKAVWNPKVDKDTLRISENLGEGSYATVGYRLGARYTEGVHYMALNRDAEAADIAHELGHVLGMDHEFIRNDRDTYLLFQCPLVRDYAPTLSRALASTPHLSSPQVSTLLCTDYDFATTHSFSGATFVKNPRRRTHDDSTHLDLESVMMYPSTSLAGAGCPGVKMECPLLKYVPEEYWFGGVREVEVIGRSGGPSVGDGEWVQGYYPHEH